MLPEFFGILGFAWTWEAPIAMGFGTSLRGTSEVVIADSDITSTRVSCMEIIKIRGIMKEFGEGKRFPDFTQHWSGRLKQVNLQT